jgi:hypothetical protein
MLLRDWERFSSNSSLLLSNRLVVSSRLLPKFLLSNQLRRKLKKF